MEKYQILEIVGDGSFGKVLRAQHKQTHAEVAIKTFKQSATSNKNTAILKTTIRELKTLNMFTQKNSPHIIKFHESFLDSGGKLNIVMEFMQKNLLHLIEKHRLGVRPVKRVKGIIAQVLIALQDMHELQLIHRDIKPENVLIDESPQQHHAAGSYATRFNAVGYVKLCDFGSVAFKDEYTPGTQKMTPYVATRWYRAPELLTGTKGGVYSEKVDIWAVGCLLAELLDGEPLFAGKNDIDQLYKIQQQCGALTLDQKEMVGVNIKFVGEYPSDTDSIPLSEDSLEKRFGRRLKDDRGMEFLLGCLRMNPVERFSAVQCLTHPWLKEVIEDFGWRVVGGKVVVGGGNDVGTNGAAQLSPVNNLDAENYNDFTLDDSSPEDSSPVVIPSVSFVQHTSEPNLQKEPVATKNNDLYSSENLASEESLIQLQNELEMDTTSLASPLNTTVHVLSNGSPAHKKKTVERVDKWNVFGESDTPTFLHLTSQEKDNLLTQLTLENDRLKKENERLNDEIDRLAHEGRHVAAVEQHVAVPTTKSKKKRPKQQKSKGDVKADLGVQQGKTPERDEEGSVGSGKQKKTNGSLHQSSSTGCCIM